LCKIGRGASNKRFRQEHGSKKDERVGYSVIWNHQKITKRVPPQNTIFSAEQSAIIAAIHSTIKEPGRKLFATDFLSTLVATSDKKDTKNFKCGWRDL
jgi:hypothetical protein